MYACELSNALGRY